MRIKYDYECLLLNKDEVKQDAVYYALNRMYTTTSTYVSMLGVMPPKGYVLLKEPTDEKTGHRLAVTKIEYAIKNDKTILDRFRFIFRIEDVMSSYPLSLRTAVQNNLFDDSFIWAPVYEEVPYKFACLAVLRTKDLYLCSTTTVKIPLPKTSTLTAQMPQEVYINAITAMMDFDTQSHLGWKQ